MALSAAVKRKYEADVNPRFNHLPNQAVAIWEGGAASVDASGDVGPLATGEDFAGFFEMDEASATVETRLIKVRTKGVVELTVVGVNDYDDVNANVYATDDNTFTLTTSGALLIGKVRRWISSTTCMVEFEGLTERSI